MAHPKLSKLELKIMDVLWTHGASSVREVLEHFPHQGRPAYTTVQTMITRLEAKKVLKRAGKLGNAHLFAAQVTRGAIQRRFIDDLLGLFGGRMQPVMAQLVETGKLTLEDVRDAEKRLRELAARKGGRS